MKRFQWGLVFIALLGLAGCRSKAGPQAAFIGDEITQRWSFPAVNLGRDGETTAEMLARFPSDVLNHGYISVFILGGTEDVLHHIDPAVTVENIARMASLAQANGIEPILAEVPPMFAGHASDDVQVQALNASLATLAQARSLKFIHYYQTLTGRPKLEPDGVHPSEQGYFLMKIALLRLKSP